MTKLRIALVQQPATSDLAANLANGLDAARRAAAEGAKVVCFAELAFTPFYPQDPSSGTVSDLAEEIPGPITEAFCALAQELGIVVVLNLFERDGERTYDSSPVIDTNGRLLGVTRMVHITDYPCFHEQDYYHPSELGAPVYDTTVGKVGGLPSATIGTIRSTCARWRSAVPRSCSFPRPGRPTSGRRVCSRPSCA